MSRFAAVLLYTVAQVRAVEVPYEELPVTKFELTSRQEYGKQMAYWTEVRYGVDTMEWTDNEGNTSMAPKLYWISKMFANPDIVKNENNLKQADDNYVGTVDNFEGMYFQTWFSFGGDNGEEINDSFNVLRMQPKEPRAAQNAVCTMRYHHKSANDNQKADKAKADKAKADKAKADKAKAEKAKAEKAKADKAKADDKAAADKVKADDKAAADKVKADKAAADKADKAAADKAEAEKETGAAKVEVSKSTSTKTENGKTVETITTTTVTTDKDGNKTTKKSKKMSIKSGGRRLMDDMSVHECPSEGDQHCDLDEDDKNVKLHQWCASTDGEKVNFPNPKIWKAKMTTPQSSLNANKCSPWSLTTLNNWKGNGIHLHAMEEKKYYLRCALVRDFEVSQDKQHGNFPKLELDTKYMVRGGTNIFDKNGKLVDSRDTGDWETILVQTKAGASMGAVVSFAGIAVSAAFLSF